MNATIVHSAHDETVAIMYLHGFLLGAVYGQKGAETAVKVLKRELDRAGLRVAELYVRRGNVPLDMTEAVPRRARFQSRAVTGEFIFGCDATTGAGVIITKDGPKYGLWERK